jgi:hypothetical protein
MFVVVVDCGGVLLFVVEDELKCRAIWFKRGDEILWEDRASVGEEMTPSSSRRLVLQIIGLKSQIVARIN